MLSKMVNTNAIVTKKLKSKAGGYTSLSFLNPMVSPFLPQALSQAQSGYESDFSENEEDFESFSNSQEVKELTDEYIKKEFKEFDDETSSIEHNVPIVQGVKVSDEYTQSIEMKSLETIIEETEKHPHPVVEEGVNPDHIENPLWVEYSNSGSSDSDWSTTEEINNGYLSIESVKNLGNVPAQTDQKKSWENITLKKRSELKNSDELNRVHDPFPKESFPGSEFIIGHKDYIDSKNRTNFDDITRKPKKGKYADFSFFPDTGKYPQFMFFKNKFQFGKKYIIITMEIDVDKDKVLCVPSEEFKYYYYKELELVRMNTDVNCTIYDRNTKQQTIPVYAFKFKLNWLGTAYEETTQINFYRDLCPITNAPGFARKNCLKFSKESEKTQKHNDYWLKDSVIDTVTFSDSFQAVRHFYDLAYKNGAAIESVFMIFEANNSRLKKKSQILSVQDIINKLYPIMFDTRDKQWISDLNIEESSRRIS